MYKCRTTPTLLILPDMCCTLSKNNRNANLPPLCVYILCAYIRCFYGDDIMGYPSAHKHRHRYNAFIKAHLCCIRLTNTEIAEPIHESPCLLAFSSQTRALVLKAGPDPEFLKKGWGRVLLKI